MIFETLRVEILSRPIYNILLAFLMFFKANLGLAIILLTLLVRLLLIKVTAQSNNMHKGMGNYHNKMKDIQDKHKDSPEKQAEEMMKSIKSGGLGSLKGCLSLLVQLPIFLALYWVVRKLAINEIPADWIYSFFWKAGNQFTDLSNIVTNFLGIDLLNGGSVVLTILAGIMIFFQMRMTMMVRPQTDTNSSLPGGQKMPDMGKMMGFMSIFMVIMMGGVVRSFPSAIGLYIITTTLFSIGQYSVQYREVLSAKLRTLFRSKSKPIVIEKK